MKSRLVRSALVVLLLAASARLGAQDYWHRNTAIATGETITYEAYYNWGFIWLNAATIRFAASDTTVNGEQRVKFESIGRTYSGYDFFFTVRDTFIVTAEPTTFDPRTYYQSNYEGKRMTYNSWLYGDSPYTLKGTCRISENKKKLTTTQIDTIRSPISFDVLTMVYKARNIDFSLYNEDDKIPIQLLINGENYDLYIRYQGKEDIQLKNGRRFHCLKFTPLLVDGTVFSGGEDMVVWVTDDPNRLPVAVEAKILVGSVKAQLNNVEGLRHPLESEY